MSTLPAPAAPVLATRVRHLAAIALALTAVLHLALVPEYLHEATVVGWLFVVGGLGGAASAAWLWAREDDRAWWTAALLGFGMAVSFLLSRTVGFLGFQEGEWELSGVVSMLLEIGIVAAFVWDRVRATTSA